MSSTHEAGDGDADNVTLWHVHFEFLSAWENLFFIALGLSSVAFWYGAAPPRALHALWLVAGWALFVPQEYLTHVHVLHLPMPRSERVYRWLYRLHYGHHDHPKRHDLMYMPLWLTLPMTLANWLMFRWITPDMASCWAAFGGAVLGYLMFEWTHLLAHVPYVPRSAFWRRVRSHHLLHHHLNERSWFAVAPGSLLMDRLCGTRPRREQVTRSPHCRFLGLDPASPWIPRARSHFAHRSSGTPEASRLWQAKPVSTSAVVP